MMRYPPNAGAPCDGWLMQRIAASHRHVIACHCAQLCPCGVDAACTQLESVSAAGPAEAVPCESGCAQALVRIPLTLCLRDACGRRFTASADTELSIPWPPAFGACRSPDSQILIMPRVRLLCANPECGCFRAQLCIELNLYLLRLEICSRCKPACPQLPLYPPPIQPRW